MQSKLRDNLLRAGKWIVPPLAVLGAVTAWFALDPGFGRSTHDVVTAMPPDAFEWRVRDYLLKNPEVIVEAMQRLGARRHATEESEVQAVLKARADEVFRESPVAGNPDGDVTVVEFFDYNCPYCRKVASVVQQVEAADPRLRFVYKEFPILGPNSVFAAKAALAAHRQGRYAEFHRALMQGRGAADQPSVLRIAAEIGLDEARLKADMADPAIQSALDRNLELARTLRIAGTPGFVVGDEILRGAADAGALRQLVDKARNEP